MKFNLLILIAYGFQFFRQEFQLNWKVYGGVLRTWGIECMWHFHCFFFTQNCFILGKHTVLGGAVASWLVRSTPERAVRVRALTGDIVLFSWARLLTLTVPLSTQVYKWVPANCWGNLTKLRGSDLRWTSIPSRGSRNTSSRFMLQKPG